MFVMETKRQLPSAPQLAKIAALLALFLLAPLVPSSLRQPCLYLLFHALVITLGVEAGFLDAISDKKPPTRTVSPSPQSKRPSVSTASVSNARLVNSTAGPLTSTPTTTWWTKSTKKLLADDVVAKPKGAGDALGMASTMVKKIKKCPSRPSIFFIGSVDDDAGDDVNVTVHEEEEEGTAGDLMSKQELFMKAEAFIGNFYSQLKMQREESWKKLQDLHYRRHQHYKANKAF